MVGPALSASVSITSGSAMLSVLASAERPAGGCAASSISAGLIAPAPFSARWVSKSSVTSDSLFIRR